MRYHIGPLFVPSPRKYHIDIPLLRRIGSENNMSRPSIDGIKQASVGAFDKARLMVGLKNGSQEETEEGSEQSERPNFVEEAADLICPELTFQQRLIGFASCFTLGCKSRPFFGGRPKSFVCKSCHSSYFGCFCPMPCHPLFRLDHLYVF